MSFEGYDLPAAAPDEFVPLPAGTYRAAITGAAMKQTKAGGQALHVQLTIAGPGYLGRMVWDTINLRHPSSAQAEEIGRQQMSSLLLAIGITPGARSGVADLIGREVEVKLAVERSEQYGDRNRVKRYSSIAGSAVPAPVTSTKPTTAAPAWVKR